MVRALFLEYAETLGVDLCFQGFDREVASLPGGYAPPAGALFLATTHTLPVGCVGIRALSGTEAELKRLYVRPEARGTGLGRRLVTEAIHAARRIGYTLLRLDTLPSMLEARALYQRIGFQETPSYRPNPIEGTTYLALDLTVDSLR